MTSSKHLTPSSRAADRELPGMVGRHPLMLEAYRQVRAVAPTDDPVMVIGETGTGKELVARALHGLSQRSRQPFFGVNAAALPESLFESELFGHERWAFSDAREQKLGLLELAHEGTFYCDELGSMSPNCQAKLLRVVEDGWIMPVGGVKPRPAAPRWVASCQGIHPRTGIGRGVRDDLWYRLCAVSIALPPLRDRVSDIPLIVAHFLALRGYPADWFEGAALELLSAAPWGGNVRQLQWAVGRLLLVNDGRRIGAGDVRRELAEGSDPVVARRRSKLLAALEANGGSVERAARFLGVHRATLYRRLRAHGLEPPRR